MKLDENRVKIVIRGYRLLWIWVTLFILSILSPQVLLSASQENECFPVASPSVLDPQDMLDSRITATQCQDPYHMAIQEYLDQNDEAAITHLKEALRLNKGNERARRLLLKIFLRSIDNQYKRKNYKRARGLVKGAKKYFPSNPEVKILYDSIQRSSVFSPRKGQTANPNSSASKSRKATKSSKAQTRTVHSASSSTSPKVVRHPSVSSRRSGISADGSKKGGYIAVVATGFLTLIGILAYAQKKTRKAMFEQMKTLHEAFQKGEAEKAALLKKVEVRRESEKRAEELYKLRKEEEYKLHVEMERRKREEEKKLLADLMEKRRKEEEHIHSELEAIRTKEERQWLLELQKKKSEEETKLMAELEQKQRRETRMRSEPEPGKKLAPLPKNEKIGLKLAQYQEKQILGILINVPPAGRDLAWERIAVQVVNLYGTSPKEAVKFLQGLAKDNNPFTRASIVSGLAKIGVSAALDIIFELQRDNHPEVKREVLKHLKSLQQNGSGSILDSHRQKIDELLQEERGKGDWVF